MPASLPPLRLQPLVRGKVAQLGAAGADWVDRLPATLAEVCRQWQLTPTKALPGGSTSYVTEVSTTDGPLAVLKLSLPDPGFAAQVDTLVRADGHGYAQVLAVDLDRSCVLLERLDPITPADAAEPERALDLLSATLPEAWRVRRPELGAPPATDLKAASLRSFVADAWTRHPQVAAEAVLERALACADRRLAAYDPTRCVVVHGDPHPGNLMRVQTPRTGAPGGHVFVDPDGFWADPTYDLGVVLRDWSTRLQGIDAPEVLRGYRDRLAAATELDPDAIEDWGFLERVSTGLYVLDLGGAQLGRQFLASAERLSVG